MPTAKVARHENEFIAEAEIAPGHTVIGSGPTRKAAFRQAAETARVCFNVKLVLSEASVDER